MGNQLETGPNASGLTGASGFGSKLGGIDNPLQNSLGGLDLNQQGFGLPPGLIFSLATRPDLLSILMNQSKSGQPLPK